MLAAEESVPPDYRYTPGRVGEPLLDLPRHRVDAGRERGVHDAGLPHLTSDLAERVGRPLGLAHRRTGHEDSQTLVHERLKPSARFPDRARVRHHRRCRDGLHALSISSRDETKVGLRRIIVELPDNLLGLPEVLPGLLRPR